MLGYWAGSGHPGEKSVVMNMPQLTSCVLYVQVVGCIRLCPCCFWVAVLYWAWYIRGCMVHVANSNPLAFPHIGDSDVLSHALVDWLDSMCIGDN